MITIYTVSHPLTNDIVYVGCSSRFRDRIIVHENSKSDSPVSKYVRYLRSQYLLPKIEILEEVEEGLALYFETYWICQLRSWGYNLMNIHKVKKPKNYIRSNHRKEIKPIRERTSRLWTRSDFDPGKTFEIETENRNVFYTNFRGMAKKFGIKRWLVFSSNGNILIATVSDRKAPNKPKKVYYVKKNKPKKECPDKRPLIRYGFKEKQPGDYLSVPDKNWVSFSNCLYQYNWHNDADKRYVNYTFNNYTKEYDVVFIEYANNYISLASA